MKVNHLENLVCVSEHAVMDLNPSTELAKLASLHKHEVDFGAKLLRVSLVVGGELKIGAFRVEGLDREVWRQQSVYLLSQTLVILQQTQRGAAFVQAEIKLA